DDVLLSSDLTHYVIPDIDIQHHGSRKLLNRIKALIKDTRQQCSLFSNEFCQGAYVERQARETLQKWQQRSIYSGALWYHNHLDCTIPIVIVTNDSQVMDLYGNQTLGIFVMTVEDYLKGFYPSHSAVHDLYESLQAVISETSHAQLPDLNLKQYKEYLPLEVLEAGIKSGRYYRGCLNVNKHNAQSEAFIQRQSDGLSSGKEISSSDIFIPGMTNRNRSVHGDVVAVELFPQSLWKGKSKALKSKDEDSCFLDLLPPGNEATDVMPTGHVVGILQRNWRDYAATFSEFKARSLTTFADQKREISLQAIAYVLVVPWDYRIPKIRISTRQANTLRDHRIVVRIDSWDVTSMYPNGHFVRSLGVIGSLDTEISTIMLEHQLFAPPFTDGQLKELPSNSSSDAWVMDPNEIDSRRDLRSSHLVFSIDPKGCEDVDDTLSVRSFGRGKIELGVHIADVTYFVRPGSLTDVEARSRSTTVYLADRRYDMLPEVLSADLCSLISGVDRYALSVMWEMDSNYKVLKTWFGRTVIRSSYKLFYEAAQAIADNQDTDQNIIKYIPELQPLDENKSIEKLTELRLSITKLMDIARHLKSMRTIEGALELESSEVQVQLSDQKHIKDLTPKKPLEVHETIAECMIFANHWVAKKIAQTFPTAALLRRHPLPRQQYFSNLVHCAKSKGFTIDSSSNKSLADSLDDCLDLKDPTFNKIMRTLATQAMSNALYFSTGSESPDEYFHYGLALNRYTHFTSPIRRYADVIVSKQYYIVIIITTTRMESFSYEWEPYGVTVHRLLLAAVRTGDKDRLLNNEELEDQCHHINTKHREAQLAQKESVEMFEALFFQSLEEKDERRRVDAVIISLRANGVLVYVPRYSIKGPVYIKNKDGQVVTPSSHVSDDVTFGPGRLVQHEFHVALHNSAGVFNFRLFDHIQVRLSVIESSITQGPVPEGPSTMDPVCQRGPTRPSPPPGMIPQGRDPSGPKMKRSEVTQRDQVCRAALLLACIAGAQQPRGGEEGPRKEGGSNPEGPARERGVRLEGRIQVHSQLLTMDPVSHYSTQSSSRNDTSRRDVIEQDEAIRTDQ
ncbi:hypothetical protein QZH41_015302, partial [Actinostola sp. cb2023]